MYVWIKKVTHLHTFRCYRYFDFVASVADFDFVAIVTDFDVAIVTDLDMGIVTDSDEVIVTDVYKPVLLQPDCNADNRNMTHETMLKNTEKTLGLASVCMFRT